eukprot:scaffold20310_cov125-Isochrysis_galbana.AAC.21
MSNSSGCVGRLSASGLLAIQRHTPHASSMWSSESSRSRSLPIGRVWLAGDSAVITHSSACRSRMSLSRLPCPRQARMT